MGYVMTLSLNVCFQTSSFTIYARDFQSRLAVKCSVTFPGKCFTRSLSEICYERQEIECHNCPFHCQRFRIIDTITTVSRRILF